MALSPSKNIEKSNPPVVFNLKIITYNCKQLNYWIVCMSVAGSPAGHIKNNKEKDTYSDFYLCSLHETLRTNRAFRKTIDSRL